MMGVQSTSLKPILVLLSLFAILALGFFVRFDNLGTLAQQS
jgi:hypothetical protein